MTEKLGLPKRSLRLKQEPDDSLWLRSVVEPDEAAAYRFYDHDATVGVFETFPSSQPLPGSVYFVSKGDSFDGEPQTLVTAGMYAADASPHGGPSRVHVGFLARDGLERVAGGLRDYEVFNFATLAFAGLAEVHRQRLERLRAVQLLTLYGLQMVHRGLMHGVPDWDFKQYAMG